MKPINYLFDISRLLVKKKLKGEDSLDQGELEMLHAWREESAMNDEVISTLDTRSREEINRRSKTGLDKEKAWRNVEARIKPKGNASVWMSLKWAAVILFPLAIGVVLYGQFQNVNENAPLLPGESRALLTLSDGSQVVLEEAVGMEIIGGTGEKVRLAQDELIYEGEDQSDHLEIYNTIETRVGNEYKLRLSDGTKVFLNAQSKLVFPVAFTGETRSVKLEGEGYFEVTPDKDRPFYVEVEGMRVQVLGTSFNVKAYTDESVTETVLVEGKVKLLNGTSQETLLSPDEKAVLNKRSKEIAVSEIDAVSATAWINGKYYFNNARLEDIMTDLARWYDFETKYSSQELREVRFEGWINRYEELDPILRIIEITNKIKIERNGKELIIS
ncbi:FecR family protein [Echinicola sp. 20G]|uniref:FecR family protein n=1 Tax=Echinicola sp. 20G TaxID=2781961 RepID=UPI0019100C61|nr:FecR family protein [Echinicola sp. 20G]